MKHLVTLLFFLLATRASLLSAAILTSEGPVPGRCGAQCENDNQCLEQKCSYCNPNTSTCEAGLPCGAYCVNDADCFPLPKNCSICTNNTCGAIVPPPPAAVNEDFGFWSQQEDGEDLEPSGGQCGDACQNNNECTTKTCSRCPYPQNTCQKGLTCGSLCTVDSDCDQTDPQCSLCTFRHCGNGTAPPSFTPYPSSAPTVPPAPSPTPQPQPPTPKNLTKACIGGPEGSMNECGPDDIVSVPENFRPETCQAFAHLLGPIKGYDYYNMGCLFNNSFSVGQRQQPPSPDCGWADAHEPVADNDGPRNSQQSYKGCSAQYEISGYCLHIWDTIIVADGWTPDTCNQYVQDLYANLDGPNPKLYYFLCTFPYDNSSTPYSVAREANTFPNPDCGWESADRDLQQRKMQGALHPEQDDKQPPFVHWPSKVCVSLGAQTRQTLNVPAQWTSDTCLAWSREFGKGDYQLGCIFNSSYSFGDRNGGTPSPNCGW